MSRIGKLPINLPKGVKIELSENQNLTVNGPHGTLNRQIPDSINIEQSDGILTFKPKLKSKETKAMHGLVRTLVNNMVIGVTDKFSKTLKLQGVGYRSQIQNNVLNLSLGFSHEIHLPIPNGIEAKVENNTTIIITGIEKEQVGLFASKIRNLRTPEPYNGKGVLYNGETLIRKAGKVGK